MSDTNSVTHCILEQNQSVLKSYCSGSTCRKRNICAQCLSFDKANKGTIAGWTSFSYVGSAIIVMLSYFTFNFSNELLEAPQKYGIINEVCTPFRHCPNFSICHRETCNLSLLAYLLPCRNHLVKQSWPF